LEQYHDPVVQRVWQREQGEGDDSITQLLLTETELLSIFQRLSSLMPQHKLHFQQLSDISQKQKSCLLGLLRLRGEKKPPLPPLKPRQETLPGLLRKGSALLNRSANAFLRFSQSGEFGGVFALLAKEKYAQLQLLLEILGKE
jgi:hypothetical protein